MLAVSVSEAGGKPTLCDLPIPDPGDHEVLIRIRSCALNFADLLMIAGTYQETPPYPLIPGLEISGIVEKVGSAVSGVSPGQRVAAQTGHGGLAEYVSCSADRIVAIPDEMPFSTASVLQIAYGTTLLALKRRARLEDGDILIVLGAAGGVGLTAVEVGKALGARVIAVARGDSKLSIAKDTGADVVVDSDPEDTLRDRMIEHGHANVVYDAVGGRQGLAAQRALRSEGRHVLIGFASGELPVLKPNHLLVKNLDVLGVNWGGYAKENAPLARSIISDVFALWSDGSLKPHISEHVSLNDSIGALEALRNRKTTGKIVVRP